MTGGGFQSSLSGSQVDKMLSDLIHFKSITINIGNNTLIKLNPGVTLLSGDFWFDWNGMQQDTVWLICKCNAPANKIQQWQGIVGTLTFLRGRNDALNGVEQYLVQITKAYNAQCFNVIQFGSSHAPYLIEAAIYEHTGQQWLGLRQRHNSTQFCHFHGLMSSDIQNNVVRFSEVSKIE